MKNKTKENISATISGIAGTTLLALIAYGLFNAVIAMPWWATVGLSSFIVSLVFTELATEYGNRTTREEESNA